MSIKSYTIENLEKVFGFNPLKKNPMVKITTNQELEKVQPKKYSGGIVACLYPISKRMMEYQLGRSINEETMKVIIHPKENELADGSDYILYMSEKSRDNLKLTPDENLAIVCNQLYHLTNGGEPANKRFRQKRWIANKYRYYLSNLVISVLITFAALAFVPAYFAWLPITVAFLGALLGIHIQENWLNFRYLMTCRKHDQIADAFSAHMMGTVDPLVQFYTKMLHNNIEPPKHGRPWKKRISFLKGLTLSQ